MRERDFSNTGRDNRRSLKSKLLLVSVIALLFSFTFAETGPLNLIYTNGQIIQSETSTTFEFDVQAYMSNTGDVIGDGMIYVQYPVDMFGDLAVISNKVTVRKTGILAETIPGMGFDLYRLVNIADTYSNVFAVTFSANYSSSDLKSYYKSVSSDPAAPSDFLHIVMDISGLIQGSVLFPENIAGYNTLFYNYEFDLLADGLDLSQAVEVIGNNDTPVITPDDPIEEPDVEPVYAGSVTLERFTTVLKKGEVELAWKTNTEKNLVEYMIERSDNSTEYSEISRTTTLGSTRKSNSYKVNDNMVIPGTSYTYRLSAIDENGISEVLATQEIVVQASRKKIIETEDFALEASYPNPFNPSFTVPFSIMTAQDVNIRLYNMSGEVVATIASGYYNSGDYNVHVDAGHLASGIYLLRAQINGQQATQKMLLVK